MRHPLQRMTFTAHVLDSGPTNDHCNHDEITCYSTVACYSCEAGVGEASDDGIGSCSGNDGFAAISWLRCISLLLVVYATKEH
jgi:hypothetical protein